MLLQRGTAVLALAAILGLAGCVAPPPRQRVVYHEGARYAPPPPPPPAQEPAYDDRECRFCGTVRDIDRVEIRQGNSGGGAVLGAIIGGLVGNSFGRGGGRAASTAVGVIGGAAVGNSIEESNDRAYSGRAWRYRVELDDGRWATVTQPDNPGYHPGDRVVVRGDHIEWPRR